MLHHRADPFALLFVSSQQISQRLAVVEHRDDDIEILLTLGRMQTHLASLFKERRFQYRRNISGYAIG